MFQNRTTRPTGLERLDMKFVAVLRWYARSLGSNAVLDRKRAPGPSQCP